MKKSITYIIVAVCIVLASCASTGSKVPDIGKMLRDATGQNGRACVKRNEVRGYGVFDKNVMTIDGRTHYYLVVVFSDCNDLQASIRSMFRGNHGEICPGGMSMVAPSDEYCVIKQMFEFENHEQALSTYNAILEKRETLKAHSHGEIP